MTNFNDFLKEQLANPEIKAEYEKLEREFVLIQEHIDSCKLKDIPQNELTESENCS